MSSELKPQELWKGTEGGEAEPLEATKQTWGCSGLGSALMIWAPTKPKARSLATSGFLVALNAVSFL